MANCRCAIAKKRRYSWPLQNDPCRKICLWSSHFLSLYQTDVATFPTILIFQTCTIFKMLNEGECYLYPATQYSSQDILRLVLQDKLWLPPWTWISDDPCKTRFPSRTRLPIIFSGSFMVPTVFEGADTRALKTSMSFSSVLKLHVALNCPSGVSNPPCAAGIPVFKCGAKVHVLPWVDVTVSPRR